MYGLIEKKKLRCSITAAPQHGSLGCLIAATNEAALKPEPSGAVVTGAADKYAEDNASCSYAILTQAA